MKKLLLIVPLVFLLCFAFSCQKAEEVAEETVAEVTVAPLSDEDVTAIKALGPAIDELGLGGNWEAFVNMFAEDMLMMPPNMPAIKGRSTYLTWIKSMGFTMTESNFEFQEIDGYGDIAYAVATYTETFTLDGVDEPIYDEGKILTILRKQSDGSWLFSIWMWASDLPLPPPPEKE